MRQLLFRPFAGKAVHCANWEYNNSDNSCLKAVLVLVIIPKANISACPQFFQQVTDFYFNFQN
jgi:hypothetical protein